jgi:hypothetical protein
MTSWESQSWQWIAAVPAAWMRQYRRASRALRWLGSRRLPYFAANSSRKVSMTSVRRIMRHPSNAARSWRVVVRSNK